jgi:hypothetical protein
VGPIDTLTTDISWDGTNTPWSGNSASKLYLQSGQFTSTLKTSESLSVIDSGVQGISWDAINTPWCGSADDKLYLQSGQFTSTIKTSEYVNSIDVSPVGVCTNDVSRRLFGIPVTIPWVGFDTLKLYLQSGQFTSTVKDSEAVGSIDSQSYGITFDGTDTPWCGGFADKLYLQSGQFTSTIKTSEDIGSIDSTIVAVSWDDSDTPWAGLEAGKLYLQSGQFTSTLKTSEDVSGALVSITGVSWDGNNTPWCGVSDSKLFLQSGQFTSTIKTSETVVSVEPSVQGISWNGTDTLFTGSVGDKLYLSSGQFTSTIKTSEYVNSIDGKPRDICVSDVSSRIGPYIPRTLDEEALSSVTFSQLAAYSGFVHIVTADNTIVFSQEDTQVQRPIYLTASNAIVFEIAARIPEDFSAEALNSFVFSQAIARAGTEYIDASNSLLFLSEADATLNARTIYSRTLGHLLEFSQEATQGIDFKVARAESTIEFSQAILATFPQSLVTVSSFEFLQGIRYTPVKVYAVSDLAEIVWTAPEDGNITLVPTGFQQTVGLIQVAGQSPPDSRINFDQEANIVHIRAADGVSKVAESVVTFTQSSQVTYGGGSTVTFSQSATVDLCTPTKSILTFAQSVDLEAIVGRTAASSIEFQQSAYHTLTRNGELRDVQCSIIAELPHYDNVKFSYPITSVTHTLTLRGAELGNRERMHFQRINRETRGGTLIVFADPIWPKNDHLVMDFVGLTETETNQVRSFVKTTLGKQVTLRDWEGRNWVGVIVSPDNPVVRDGALCMNTVTIELEGHAGYDVTAESTVTFSQTAVGTKT